MQSIKKVNVNWDRGKMFQNLRDDATFNLVPSRKEQEDAVAEAKRQETLQAEPLLTIEQLTIMG